MSDAGAFTGFKGTIKAHRNHDKWLVQINGYDLVASTGQLQVVVPATERDEDG
jgi:hypothetical protein